MLSVVCPYLLPCHDLINNQSAYTFLGSFLGAATLGQCHSPLSVGQTIAGKYTDTASGHWEESTAVVISTGVSVVGVHLNGYVFQNGVASTAPGSASASTTPGGITPTTSSTTASNTASQTSAPSYQIGSGEKIGLGVGISLGFVGICCLVIAFVLLKRRSRPRSPVYPAGPAEAPSYPPNYPISRRAVGSHSIYEAPGKPGEGRTMAETHDVSSGHNKGPAEMWVSPSQGG